jgi:hypothetical protein
VSGTLDGRAWTSEDDGAATRAALERACRPGEEAAVTLRRSAIDSIRWRGDHRSTRSATVETDAIAVQAAPAVGWGFAPTVETAIDHARSVADPGAVPLALPTSPARRVPTWDPTVEEVVGGPDALEVLAGAMRGAGYQPLEIDLRVDRIWCTYANTSNLCQRYAKSRFALRVQVLLPQGMLQPLSLRDACWRRLVARARALVARIDAAGRDAGPLPRLPSEAEHFVFVQEAAQAVLELVAAAAIDRAATPAWAERLVDDPRVPLAWRTRPFDATGAESRAAPLVATARCSAHEDAFRGRLTARNGIVAPDVSNLTLRAKGHEERALFARGPAVLVESVRAMNDAGSDGALVLRVEQGWRSSGGELANPLERPLLLGGSLRELELVAFSEAAAHAPFPAPAVRLSGLRRLPV